MKKPTYLYKKDPADNKWYEWMLLETDGDMAKVMGPLSFIMWVPIKELYALENIPEGEKVVGY